jgi:hypothetical protein
MVLGRNNHFGSRSKRGTEVAALFYSLLESARLNGLDPSRYLEQAARAAIRGETVPCLTKSAEGPPASAAYPTCLRNSPVLGRGRTLLARNTSRTTASENRDTSRAHDPSRTYTTHKRTRAKSNGTKSVFFGFRVGRERGKRKTFTAKKKDAEEAASK